MKLKTYYRQLNHNERQAYALRARTTINYLDNHLIPGRKLPRQDLLKRLAEASEGNVELDDVLDHFFKQPEANSLSRITHNQQEAKQ